jgi:hypothetical protein
MSGGARTPLPTAEPEHHLHGIQPHEKEIEIEGG